MLFLFLHQAAFCQQNDAPRLRNLLQNGEAVFAPEMVGLRVFLVNAQPHRGKAQRRQVGQHLRDKSRAHAPPLQGLVHHKKADERGIRVRYSPDCICIGYFFNLYILHTYTNFICRSLNRLTASGRENFASCSLLPRMSTL